MALPVATQARYWGIAAAILFFALWFLGDVILPSFSEAQLPMSWIRSRTGWSGWG